MKCYHDVGETSTTVSLADALLKISEYHCVDAYTAAGMLELSKSYSPVTVMDGTIHQEDDVPVLDIDRVVEDWFALKAKLVLALHPRKAFTAMIVCNSGYDGKLTADYRFNLAYADETKGVASEATFHEFLRRVDWTINNEAKVLSIGHDSQDPPPSPI
jgi:hypothetical protein